MSDVTTTFAATHPSISYWLDTGPKLGALVLGGLWTYWNYSKSRTYAQKLGLEVTGAIFFRDDLYIDIDLVLRNTGGSNISFKQKELPAR